MTRQFTQQPAAMLLLLLLLSLVAANAVTPTSRVRGAARSSSLLRNQQQQYSRQRRAMENRPEEDDDKKVDDDDLTDAKQALLEPAVQDVISNLALPNVFPLLDQPTATQEEEEEPTEPTDNNDEKNNKEQDDGFIPDDVYHCADPDDVWDAFKKDDTVHCDWDTYVWDLDALDPWEAPRHCRDEEWEFKGAVEDLRDWEEPCYLWAITYGDLKALALPLPDTQAPFSMPPSASPTQSPTSLPTPLATKEDEDPKDEEEDQATDSTQATNATQATSDHESTVAHHEYPPSMATTTERLYYLSTLVVTLTIAAPERRQLRTTQEVVLDHEPLQKVADTHVRRELYRHWKDQRKGLDIQVAASATNVRSLRLANGTVVATQALSGTVRVIKEEEKDEWVFPDNLDTVVEQAFEDKAASRFVNVLQESDDPVWKRTVSLEMGLPLDLLQGAAPVQQSPTAVSSSNDSGTITIVGWTVSLSTLAIIAGGAALVSIFLLVAVWCRMRCIRREESERDEVTHKPTLSDDGMDIVDDRKKKDSNKGRRRTSSEASHSQSTEATNNKKIPFPDLLSPESDSSAAPRYFQNLVSEIDDDDNRSYATSTYSYLESSHVNGIAGRGDASLSGAYGGGPPAFLYGGGDDESVQSKAMWSLIDGIGPGNEDEDGDEEYNYHDTATPTNVATKEAPMLTPQDTISPTNMMISTVKKSNTSVDQYDDEEDQSPLASFGGSIWKYNCKSQKEKLGEPSPKSSTTSGMLKMTGKSILSIGNNNQYQQVASTGTPSGPFKDKTTTSLNRPMDEALIDARNSVDEEDDTSFPVGRRGVSARKSRKSINQSLAKLSCALPSSPSGANLKAAPSDEMKSSFSLSMSASHDENDESKESRSRSMGSRGGRNGRRRFSSSTFLSGTSSTKGVDTSASSKSSGLVPDRLFSGNDTSLESSMDRSKIPVTSPMVTVDGSQLMKNEKGEYVLDTMSSF